MRQSFCRWAVYGLALAAWTWAGSSAPAQDSKPRQERPKPASKPQAKDQKVSGVIVKAEDLEKDSKNDRATARGKRLTINTAVVWSDWVRDQATATASASPREAARKGANSVATRGEPKSEDMLVVVEVTVEPKIETRFRSATEEVTEGATTPAGAAQKDPTDGSRPEKSTTKREAARPVQYDLSTLKPGLFVDIEYRRDHDRNQATKVFVLRPVGGANIPAGQAAPKPTDRQR
ncbi:MAG TPA: hypothetical protein VGZ22_23900 [Isosphaeraceae bacterium]|jgi:hypothetical protein|nr:hypothetical protein [Isosphaeraceae bacterium]